MNDAGKYWHHPHAIMLRDMHSAGVPYRRMEKTIGYSATQLYKIAMGQHLPRPHTQTDIEETWLRWRETAKAVA